MLYTIALFKCRLLGQAFVATLCKTTPLLSESPPSPLTHFFLFLHLPLPDIIIDTMYLIFVYAPLVDEKAATY